MKPRKIVKPHIKKKLIRPNCQFKCQYCGRQIYAKMNLLKHEPLCKIVGKYKDGENCLICKGRIGTSNLKDHFREKHLDLFNDEEKEQLQLRSNSTCKYCHVEYRMNIRPHEIVCGQLVNIVKGSPG